MSRLIPKFTIVDPVQEVSKKYICDSLKTTIVPVAVSAHLFQCAWQATLTLSCVRL